MKKIKHKAGGKSRRQAGPAATNAPARATGVAALFSRALTDHQAGRLDAAEAGYDAVLTLDPGHANALNNLAVMRRRQRRFDEALGLYRKALERAWDDPAMHSNMGCVLVDLRRDADAVKAMKSAVALRPDYAEAWFNLGNCLRSLHAKADAVRAYRRAIVANPMIAEPYACLGDFHRDEGALGQAVDSYVAAIKRRPDMVEALNNLGEALKDQARLGDAGNIFQEGMRHHPDNALVHGNLLFLLHYSTGITPEAMYRAHVEWNERHAAPLLPAAPHAVAGRDPGRRLRVGYVSPDFVTHSCAYFSEPLLSAHDPAAVEVFCYPTTDRRDRTTERFQALAAGWRPLAGLDDEAAAAAIRQDRVDILVDMAGHTGSNRLLVFARKPAPIQVTWLGYPDTTGMTAIDYRFTDAIADPPGVADTYASERLVRLDGGFLAFRPVIDLPLAPTPPSAGNGYVTFGSFNNLTKTPAEVVRVWSEILKQAPGSRLILKSRALGDPPTKQRYAQMFAAHGVAPDRVDLLTRIDPVENHLRAYDRIDIGLDPFPYNGTTTTCEALWMGVPVITWLGAHHVARVGGSLLTHCGLEELVAHDEADYIARAVALAGDPGRLLTLRQGMRTRLEASPLTDHIGFARRVEAAYRRFWRDWLAGHPA